MTAFIAPLAAQMAALAPTTNATTEVLVDVSCCNLSIVSITAAGATGLRNSFSVSYAPTRSSRPTRNTIAGKNASSELNATCAESPIASSSRNDLNARLKTSSQSRGGSRQGLRGSRPTSTIEVVTSAFATLAGEEAHRRADAAREEEACTERAGRDHGQVRPELAGDVGRLAEALAE